MTSDELGFAFLFIDVDGYCPGGIDQREIVGPGRDGYRPRELGWLFCSSAGSQHGAFYFTDQGITGLPPLTVHDSGVRHVLTKVHGLPLNSYGKAIEPGLLFRSDEFLKVLAGLCVAVSEDHRELIVVHKGGNEGYWAQQAVPGVQTLDLAHYACPKVDRLIKEHPEWLKEVPTACQHHEIRVIHDKKKDRFVHCPTQEVALFARWIASGAILDELIDDD